MDEIFNVCNYFYNHPIMLLGLSISGMVMSICIMNDKKGE